MSDEATLIANAMQNMARDLVQAMLEPSRVKQSQKIAAVVTALLDHADRIFNFEAIETMESRAFPDEPSDGVVPETGWEDEGTLEHNA